MNLNERSSVADGRPLPQGWRSRFDSILGVDFFHLRCIATRLKAGAYAFFFVGKQDAMDAKRRQMITELEEREKAAAARLAERQQRARAQKEVDKLR
jgi:hypothetical protein